MAAVPQLYKWDDIVLENVRDGISRTFIAGDREITVRSGKRIAPLFWKGAPSLSDL